MEAHRTHYHTADRRSMLAGVDWPQVSPLQSGGWLRDRRCFCKGAHPCRNGGVDEPESGSHRGREEHGGGGGREAHTILSPRPSVLNSAVCGLGYKAGNPGTLPPGGRSQLGHRRVSVGEGQSFMPRLCPPPSEPPRSLSLHRPWLGADSAGASGKPRSWEKHFPLFKPRKRKGHSLGLSGESARTSGPGSSKERFCNQELGTGSKEKGGRLLQQVGARSEPVHWR